MKRQLAIHEEHTIPKKFEVPSNIEKKTNIPSRSIIQTRLTTSGKSRNTSTTFGATAVSNIFLAIIYYSFDDNDDMIMFPPPQLERLLS